MDTLFVVEIVLVVFGALMGLYLSFYLALRSPTLWFHPIDKWFISGVVFVLSLGAVPFSVSSPPWRHFWTICGVLALLFIAVQAAEGWLVSRGSTADPTV